MLRTQRPQLQPLESDRIKLRAMSGARRSTPPQRKGFFMRTRLVTLLTVAAFALSGGTAAAGLGLFNFGGGFSGFFDSGTSASYHQYRPPCQTGWNMGFNGQCVHAPPFFFWRFIFNSFCWIPNSHGGFTWGFGNGWVVTND